MESGYPEALPAGVSTILYTFQIRAAAQARISTRAMVLPDDDSLFAEEAGADGFVLTPEEETEAADPAENVFPEDVS